VFLATTHDLFQDWQTWSLSQLSRKDQVQKLTSPFILSPLTRDRIGVQSQRAPSTKILNTNAMKFWTQQDSVGIIREQCLERPIIEAPLFRIRGRVEVVDLIIPRVVLVLRNEG